MKNDAEGLKISEEATIMMAKMVEMFIGDLSVNAY